MIMYPQTCNAVAMMDETEVIEKCLEENCAPTSCSSTSNGSSDGHSLCQLVRSNGGGVRCTGASKDNHCFGRGSHKAVNTWCTKDSDDIKPGGTVAASNAAIFRSTSLFVAGRSHGGWKFDVRVSPAKCAARWWRLPVRLIARPWLNRTALRPRISQATCRATIAL
jgi:hypothetical protein